MTCAAVPSVEAAGALLWRPADEGVEVALVHRPRYDDWSLPKGKLEPGEHPLLAAMRETEEETGHRGVPGRTLGELRYTVPAGPKRVRYWAARATSGTFTPGREVDELAWLPAADARGVLAVGRDREVLERFLVDPRPTSAVVLLRHASAGDRGAWDGEDRLRPLDARGHEQAAAWARLLQAYAVSQARAADLERCTQTLEPWGLATGSRARRDASVGAPGYARDPQAAVDALARLVRDGPTVVCSQREVVPDLAARLATALRCPLEAAQVGQVPRGSAVVLHLADGGVVAWEWLVAP